MWKRWTLLIFKDDICHRRRLARNDIDILSLNCGFLFLFVDMKGVFLVSYNPIGPLTSTYVFWRTCDIKYFLNIKTPQSVWHWQDLPVPRDGVYFNATVLAEWFGLRLTWLETEPDPDQWFLRNQDLDSDSGRQIPKSQGKIFVLKKLIFSDHKKLFRSPWRTFKLQTAIPVL